ncbi:MAG: portal protein, partial [Acidaminococcaceae bacterium]
SGHEGTWKRLSKYINPYRGRFNVDTHSDAGSRKDTVLLDPYPMQAHAKCAAGLHSGLTSPSRPWFELSLQDAEKAKYHSVKIWLDDVKDFMMGIYAKSNIYNMLLQIEAELSQFGTAGALLLQDYNTAIWSRPYTCGEYAGSVDSRGRIAQFCRRFEMTAWQMVQEFGEDACSEAVKTAYRGNDLKMHFEINCLIEENLKYDPAKLAVGNFKYRSYYWESGSSGQFLKIAGYNEQPFLMPRWLTIANGAYGTGPGHNALGDCMQLQKMEQIDLRILEYQSNPSLVVPVSVAKVNRLPGRETYVPDHVVGQIKPLYETNGSRQDINQKIEAKHQLIAAAFYNDLFVMLNSRQDNPQMTAREVAERHEEKLLMLSPVLEQMHNEVLAPLTRRTFEICLRNGVLPPMPEEIDAEEIKVDFVSLLAQAQKMVATPSIERTLSFAGSLAGAVPEIMDNLNMDAVLRKHASLNGTPESILRSEDEVTEIRKQRAAAMEQQKQMEQATAMAQPLKNGVEAAKLLSETPVTNSNNLLGDILKGGGI